MKKDTFNLLLTKRGAYAVAFVDGFRVGSVERLTRKGASALTEREVGELVSSIGSDNTVLLRTIPTKGTPMEYCMELRRARKKHVDLRSVLMNKQP